jgi:hypothetical protein
MNNIKIEVVASNDFKYPYMEVFLKGSKNPFLDIGITDRKKLSFKFYSSKEDIDLTLEELQHLIKEATTFLPKVLVNEEFYENEWNESSLER